MGNKPFAIFAGGAGVVIGAWILLRTVFSTMTPDAIALMWLITAGTGVFAILLMAKLFIAIIERFQAPYQNGQQSQIIEGRYQIQPASDGFVQVDDNHYVSRLQVEKNAQRILTLMMPAHLPLTRDAIQRVCGIQGHEQITSALDLIAEWGYCTAGTRGRERQWITSQEGGYG